MKQNIILSISIAFCAFFYLTALNTGTPTDDVIQTIFNGDAPIDKMIAAREETYQHYEEEEKSRQTLHLSKETLYYNLLRKYIFQSCAHDSTKVIALLQLMRQNKGDQKISYHYGGMYLYPLGIYMFILDKVGIINAHSDLRFYLLNPSENGKIITAARLFIVIFLLITLYIFYLLAKRYVSFKYAITGLLLYGLSPLVVVYAHDIKPWIYTSLFIVLTMYFEKHIMLSSMFAGMAMGTMAPSGFIVLHPILRHKSWKKLFIAISICCGTFIITNPYYVLSFKSVFWFQSSYHHNYFIPNPHLVTFLFNNWIYMFGFILPIAFLNYNHKRLILMFILGILVICQISLTRLAVTYIPIYALLCIIAAKRWTILRYVLYIQIVVFIVINCCILSFYITGNDTPFQFTQRYIKENIDINMFKQIKGLKEFDIPKNLLE